MFPILRGHRNKETCDQRQCTVISLTTVHGEVTGAKNELLQAVHRFRFKTDGFHISPEP